LIFKQAKLPQRKSSYIDDGGTNNENSEIATFVYSQNFRISESVVGEYLRTPGTMESLCNAALYVDAFEGQLNSVPIWELKTFYESHLIL